VPGTNLLAGCVPSAARLDRPGVYRRSTSLPKTAL